MATPGDWEPRRRGKMLSLYAADLLSPAELIGSLLDTFTAGQEAAESAADPPAVREQIRVFLAGYRPDPLPPVFVFGRLDPDEADRWYRERQGKYTALLAVLELRSPPSGVRWSARTPRCSRPRP